MTEQPHEPNGPAPEHAFAAPDHGQQQYAQQFPQPYGQPAYFAPTAPAPSRNRRAWIPVVGVVALAAAFGAGLAVGRTTAPKASTASSALPGAITVTSTASNSSTAPASPGSAAAISPGNLVNALLPVPAGGRLRSATGAGPNGSLTLSQYVSMLYPGSAGDTTTLQLQARGFTAGATRWMDTASGQEISIYLTAFQGDNGAQSYALSAVHAHAADSAGQTRFAVPELTDGQGFEAGTLDKYGNTVSSVYGAVGNVMIIVHCYTPAKLDRTALLSLVAQQVARLTTYEKAS